MQECFLQLLAQRLEHKSLFAWLQSAKEHTAPTLHFHMFDDERQINV